MADNANYYAVISGGRTAEDPSGLARRRQLESGGFVDEALQQDLAWAPTSAIVEWQRDALDFELVEIGESEAQALIEWFRHKWGAER